MLALVILSEARVYSVPKDFLLRLFLSPFPDGEDVNEGTLKGKPVFHPSRDSPSRLPA